MLTNKFRAYLNIARESGVVPATVYAAFKMFPSKFALLNRRNTGVSSLLDSAIDYRILINQVEDDVKWIERGGREKPVAPKGDAGQQCFIWFVPDWTNVWGGGHYTLFRFANHFARHGGRQIIYIYNNQRHANPRQLQAELDGALPDCKVEVIVDPAKLPACDVALATTWQSAYHAKSFPFAAKKFYFMQDYESLFYAFGTASMQASNTYKFGFTGVTGGNWLRGIFESYGGKAQHYFFAADKDIFYPVTPDGKVRDKVAKVFFYGRLSTDRRCFELGMAALNKIAVEFPDVEIVIAGLDLKVPPPFKATLLGNLSLKQTGDLYRTCDVGISFSGTNLSYIPVELMASGCPVLSNNGPHVEWHCRHGENAWLADPTPSAMVEAFRALYNDRDLRQKIATGGVKTMACLSWDDEMEKIYRYVAANMAA